MHKLIIWVMFFLATATVHADIFRCESANGKVVYQESPCGAGSQRALDNSDQQRRDRDAQTRKADEQRQREQVSETRQQWAACKAKNDCVDFCYIAGESLAVVYFANLRSVVEYEVMAPDIMRQGCEKQVGSLSKDCVRMCESGFKLKAKAILKGK